MDLVRVVTYRESWPREFDVLAEELGNSLGSLALQIDHIGSTSIPGMPAKDVIDAQVLVASLDRQGELVSAFSVLGFRQAEGAWNRRDHVPEWWRGRESEWDKLVFGPPADRRLCNVHVRRIGAANATYARLFRDYLRAHEGAAAAYGEFKKRLANRFPDDLSTYGFLKDPICDLIVDAAARWGGEWEYADATAG